MHLRSLNISIYIENHQILLTIGTRSIDHIPGSPTALIWRDKQLRANGKNDRQGRSPGSRKLCFYFTRRNHTITDTPESKVYGANMGPNRMDSSLVPEGILDFNRF